MSLFFEDGNAIHIHARRGGATRVKSRVRSLYYRNSAAGESSLRQTVKNAMAKETEIKLKINDVPAFHRALKRMGVRLAGPGISRVHEENVIFDTPQGGLAKHGQLLRIRTETPEVQKTKKSALKQRVILTFKQPMTRQLATEAEGPSDGPYKVRDEIEVEVAESGNLTRIFEGLGMSGWFRYEKYRTTFRLPASKAWAKGLLIELDETPIGTFVELEGPAAAIDRAAEELGHSKGDYVLKNYLRLYMEDCRRKGEQPSHMLFPNRR
jgi:adenylate cyclase class 2